MAYLHFIIENKNVCAFNSLLHWAPINLLLESPPLAIPYIKCNVVSIPSHVENYSTVRSGSGSVVCQTLNAIIDIEMKPKIKRRKCGDTRLKQELF